VLSLHAEACPELNGNSEGDVSCVFSFTAALFGARLAPLTYPQTSPVRACSCDYQVPFRHHWERYGIVSGRSLLANTRARSHSMTSRPGFWDTRPR
jgi:hypothetical protein